MIWKSHDDSIVQRSAIDQARQDKTGVHHTERRRNNTTSADESTPSKDKAIAS